MSDDRTAADLRPSRIRRGEAAAAVEVEQVGRYQLLFELARGGMGTIHAARLVGPHGFAHLVAVKRLLAAPASPAEATAFLDEARLVAGIYHPNVVEIFELLEHRGALHIVMQLVPGVSLARLLARAAERGEALDPWLVSWLLAEAAAGLHAAHELCDAHGEPLGLVHRDVSPENVLLAFDGRVLVGDFGVAKWRNTSRSTESGVIKGKLAYMSPEQTGSGPLDRSTDVFALGVVAHEALSGRRLFAGTSPAETLRRVLEHDPPDPRAARPEVPEALAALVLRCLHKSPAKRPPSAGEVASTLRALLRHERRMVDATDLSALITRLFPGDRERLAARLASAARLADTTLDPARGNAVEASPSGARPSKAKTPRAAADPTTAAEAHLSVSATALPLRPVVHPRTRTLALVSACAAALVAAAFLFASRSPAPPASGSSGPVASPAPVEARPTTATTALAATTGAQGPSALAPSDPASSASGPSALAPSASGPPAPLTVAPIPVASGVPGAPASTSAAVVAIAKPSPRPAVATATATAPTTPSAPATPTASAHSSAPPAARTPSSKGVPFNSLGP